MAKKARSNKKTENRPGWRTQREKARRTGAALAKAKRRKMH